jgi:hypothetical protein
MDKVGMTFINAVLLAGLPAAALSIFIRAL